ncbi:MAG TPA: PadR family transcriptional regulator [Armatimonadota bacterium]|nr:PadR family transcriptional regulator [Armatimonadota bacterium]
MERGSLRPILLDILRDAPRHGYEIIKAFEERSGGQYAPSPGAVYPTLQYLEDLGQVRSIQSNDRRVYELTDAGRSELEAQAERVAGFWAAFAERAPSEAAQHDVGFLQDAMHDLARTIWTGLREAIANSDQETIRRVRLSVQRCEDEIRGLIAGNPS